jgi:hypothetical protein
MMVLERFNRLFKTDSDKDADVVRAIELLRPELSRRMLEEDEKRVTRCLELLAQREAIEREKAETMATLRAALVEAQEEEQRLADTLQSARRKCVAAEYARLAARSDFISKLSPIDEELRNYVPEEIEQFIGEMHKADNETRLKLDTTTRSGRPNRTGHIVDSIFYSNRAAIEERRRYIKAAITEAHEIRFEPLSRIVKRLSELRAGMPDFLHFETVRVPNLDVSELRH